jgi:ElaB/YqjD/DUF883 family membrane-anchored ribosome-binding protein
MTDTTDPKGNETANEAAGNPAQPGGRSVEQIERDIEVTRADMGDTVEALAEKTDVKAQAKHRADSIKDSALHKKDEFVSRAKEATPDSASAGAQQAVTAIKRDPVPFTGIAVFAAGLLVGWLIGRR